MPLPTDANGLSGRSRTWLLLASPKQETKKSEPISEMHQRANVEAIVLPQW